MKIYLYKSKDPLDIITKFDMKKFDTQMEWLTALPKTKRGNCAFRATKDLAVVFSRRIDATAFRLTFGL